MMIVFPVVQIIDNRGHYGSYSVSWHTKRSLGIGHAKLTLEWMSHERIVQLVVQLVCERDDDLDDSPCL